MSEQNISEQTREHYESRIEDIKKLWALYREGNEEADEDLGRWEEYGLCFDYVPAGTFNDQDFGYWRYQLSWGGGQEEFRFYADSDFKPYTIEFWYLDWGTGAHVHPTGSDLELLREIWADWCECELPQSVKAQAVEA